MEFGWTEEQRAFREEVRRFIQEHRTPELVAEIHEGGERGRGPALQAFREAMNAAGLTTIAWPEEYGGQNRGGFYAWLLAEELAYWQIPFDSLSIYSIGYTIQRFGSERQKREWLPKIVSGEMTFALGYTEPNAGTDLASLQTRAVRDGDEWVINGQKMYGGFGRATHAWLAARTDPEAPKHRGISVLVFPTTTPGITVRPMQTMARYETSETFLENVRIPVDSLVGEENRGWYYMTNALDLERFVIEPFGFVQRWAEDLVTYIKAERPELLDDPVVRTELSKVRLDQEISRALATTNAAIVDSGNTPTMEASMVKVFGSETRYRIHSLALDLLGPSALLQRESEEPGAMGGHFEEMYRASPQNRFAGGTNDVQRRIIATRGLGLPRA